VLCAAILAATFYYVFHIPAELAPGPEQTRVAYLRERKEAVYENLRDLNFEYKAGKVPDADYHNLKNSLEEEAAAILSEIARLESPSITLPGRKGQRA
jgi:hypothetical protein